MQESQNFQKNKEKKLEEMPEENTGRIQIKKTGEILVGTPVEVSEKEPLKEEIEKFQSQKK